MKLICSRKVDNLGRIVLPLEVRTEYGMDAETEIDIFDDGQSIILKKPGSACVICKSEINSNSKQVNGKSICHDCVAKIKS